MFFIISLDWDVIEAQTCCSQRPKWGQSLSMMMFNHSTRSTDGNVTLFTFHIWNSDSTLTHDGKLSGSIWPIGHFFPPSRVRRSVRPFFLEVWWSWWIIMDHDGPWGIMMDHESWINNYPTCPAKIIFPLVKIISPLVKIISPLVKIIFPPAKIIFPPTLPK